MTATFERSMAHWSEEGRSGMNAFYEVATRDYRLLAEAWDWATILAELPSANHRVLDIACGSGKFPAALSAHASLTDRLGPDARIPLDLLDPSVFSIDEAASSLRAPFVAGRKLCMKLQDLPDDEYPLLWATHGLYAVPIEELEPALSRLLAVKTDPGLGFIAQAHRDAHYVRFHDLHLRSRGSGQPYTAAEDIIDCLERLGARVEVRELEYDGVVKAGRDDVAEGFLQRCLFDDRLSLSEMFDDPELGPYLRACRRDDGSYRFAQRVAMIRIR